MNSETSGPATAPPSRAHVTRTAAVDRRIRSLRLARLESSLWIISKKIMDPEMTMAYMPYPYTSPYDPGREDEGLFGPESVTWRIMSSRIMWLAVVRALYLQALHPRVIRGTLQNAPAITEPADAWARLRRTRKFIEARTFGTRAEAERAAGRVRKIHESLTGTDPDGTRFR